MAIFFHYGSHRNWIDLDESVEQEALSRLSERGNRPLRILMLAPQPFFEPRGTPLSVLGRLKALSALGHEVDLVTYHIGQDVTIPEVAVYRIPRVPFIKEIAIGPSLPKLLLDLLLICKAFQLLLRNQYDLLHTHEEAGFFGMALSRIFRLRHLYDMHSSLPQQLSNFQFTSFRPLVKTFEWLERRLVTSSHAVITICPALEDHVKELDDEMPEVMIENVATESDPVEVTTEMLGTFRADKPWLENRKIVLYSGTFEIYQGLDLLAASALRVVQEHKDALFLMIGGTPLQVQLYQQRVAELGLTPYFHFTGNRPPTEVPMYVKLCDVLVSPRTEGTNTPLKIYSYMQSGKPIVATNLYTHTQVLDRSVSVLVEPTKDALADGILSVLNDPRLASDLGARARRLFETNYNYDVYLRKTELAIRMAVGQDKTPPREIAPEVEYRPYE